VEGFVAFLVLVWLLAGAAALLFVGLRRLARWLIRPRYKVQKPPRKPTQLEDFMEALRRFKSNVFVIYKAPLPDESKAALLENEKRTLESRVSDMME
jgi:hypothetical protein